jgi:DNA-binding NarL/FixJ family response regulator
MDGPAMGAAGYVSKPDQRIAQELCISPRTVENHISHIYLTSGCTTHQELIGF